jgi:hypothetical protein
MSFIAAASERVSRKPEQDLRVLDRCFDFSARQRRFPIVRYNSRGFDVVEATGHCSIDKIRFNNMQFEYPSQAMMSLDLLHRINGARRDDRCACCVEDSIVSSVHRAHKVVQTKERLR